MFGHLLLGHPCGFGETYFERQRAAFGCAAELVTVAVVCTTHAWQRPLRARGRRRDRPISRLHHRVIAGRTRATAAQDAVMGD
jgi:hypothetical protein